MNVGLILFFFYYGCWNRLIVKVNIIFSGVASCGLIISSYFGQGAGWMDIFLLASSAILIEVHKKRKLKVLY